MLDISIAPGPRNNLRNKLINMITIKTITTTRVEKAAATPNSNSVILSRIRTVIRVQFMEIKKMVALIAVIERINTIPKPLNRPGRISGMVIRLKVVVALAPKLKDASSMLGSIC
jgi:regulator of sirC expression with transglutaminase-like and TPR domain